MNDDTIADLKQFIAATVKQETVDVRTLIDEKIDTLVQKLSKKIDNLSQSVAEAMGTRCEATDTQLHNHEQRIARLGQKAA